MNSSGTTPPLVASTNSKPTPGSCGSTVSTTWPYWPLPPDWRTNLASTSFAGLPVGFRGGPLWLSDVGFHAEFALHAVDDDFQVELAHAGNDGLARFLVGAQAERRIFRGQAAEGDAHLFLVGLGLGLDGLRDHGLREHHALERDNRFRIAQRLPGPEVL